MGEGVRERKEGEREERGCGREKERGKRVRLGERERGKEREL